VFSRNGFIVKRGFSTYYQPNLNTSVFCEQQKNCNLRMLAMPKRLATFYDKTAWMSYLVFAWAQALLLLIPVGRRIEGPATASGRNYYRHNGGFFT
jgi:hypothetical protein